MAKLSWAGRIQAAKRRKKFLQSDLKDTNSWKTGILGDWSGFFQADEDGAPFGKTLCDLDQSFADAIAGGDMVTAETICNKVESYMKRNVARRKNPLSKDYSVTAKITGADKTGKRVRVKAKLV